ncbi:MAG: serine hydrolase, partial [Ruminococcaceae bacterium]|nr:serine hydrolase [Oscillospiraceae bacterium]
MSILERFNAEMKRRMVRLHGAVLMSNGEVIDEVYNAPYTADSRTRMYSSSKSVAAVAIGKLVKEGKLSLDDRIVDVFADRFDMADAPERLREQTIRHMLTMTTAYAIPTYGEKNKDWLASYFRGKSTHYAGTIWNYDSCGSYVLGAVTKHLTGLDFVEYLRPEFDIMGVNKGVWCLA